jgi:hypothetical protein
VKTFNFRVAAENPARRDFGKAIDVCNAYDLDNMDAHVHTFEEGP